MIEPAIYYIARCDRCKVSYIEVSENRATCVKRINEAGWLTLECGIWCLCPECREKRSRE